VVVTTTFPGREGDGTPAFVLTLCESMPDVDITVVAPWVPGAARREQIGGVEVRRVRYAPPWWPGVADDAIMPAIRAQPLFALQLPFLMFALLWGSHREVRRTHVDVVNAHWILPGGLIALVLRAIGGPRYVLTVHGGDAYTQQGGVVGAVKRAVVRRASVVAPVSRDIAHALDLDGSPVLRMGVDTGAIRAAVQPRRPRPGELLFIGRLADKKGVDGLLRALADVPDASLVVIGDGPDRVTLERLARELGLEDRVRFRGRQGRDAVLAALAEATAVVIPSRVGADGDQEGTPVVLAEAMAAGVPVVASDLGGLGECIDDGRTGLLVPPDDVAALSAALHSVVAGTVDLDALGAAASAEAKTSLDIGAVGEAYTQLFRDVAR
jgi:glycosyltransferase involved in cell wall biosynthesis